MTKKAKTPRKRKLIIARKRPVLSVRLPEKIFADIQAEAAVRNVSVTEIVYHRLVAYEMYKGLVTEKGAVALSQEVEARLIRYEEMLVDQAMVDDASLGAWLNSDTTNATINKLAERIAAALKDKDRKE
jgi:hypothetical protein